MKISCIYRIVSNINPEKIYIGSALDFGGRKRMHLSLLKRDKHHSILLQRHVNKYGVEDFYFEILERVFDISQLIQREQHYLDTYKPTLNILKVAGNTFGRLVSEETRRKISLANKGNKYINSSKFKKGKAMIWTEEMKQKVSKANTGIKRTIEQVNNHKKSMEGKYKAPWNKGKTGVYSQDVLKIMSDKKREFRLGKKHSEETKLKMSLASKGKKKNPDSISKMKETKRINRIAHLKLSA